MPVKPVGARQPIKFFDPAEKIVGRDLECVSEATQVVKRRLSRSRLEMRNRGRLETGPLCQVTLVEPAFLSRCSQPFRENLGGSA
jgi:hypothetical protein